MELESRWIAADYMNVPRLGGLFISNRRRPGMNSTRNHPGWRPPPLGTMRGFSSRRGSSSTHAHWSSACKIRAEQLHEVLQAPRITFLCSSARSPIPQIELALFVAAEGSIRRSCRPLSQAVQGCSRLSALCQISQTVSALLRGLCYHRNRNEMSSSP